MPVPPGRVPVAPVLRWKVLLRAGWRCEDCRKPRKLELHHLRYWIDGPNGPRTQPIFGRETEGDLAALCRRCHEGRHLDPTGAYYADPDEMRARWSRG
jgi:hypothetical protein